MLIFEKSDDTVQWPEPNAQNMDIPLSWCRQAAPKLPELAELDVVRHYTKLSQKNYSIDTNFYPLGSCTMKFNPPIAHALALLPGLAHRHPNAPESASQGFLSCMYELQEDFKVISGMPGVALNPMAGAQGEYAGVLMIKRYHENTGDVERTEMLIPDAAHGTNPASAAKAGFSVREIKTAPNGDIDLEDLVRNLGPRTAGIMLTNPSTLGVFERQIEVVAQKVHAAGGLLYYDGANLNAIVGKVRPGDMGFDVMHINTHKTFATPHGGGGPGAGPVMCSERLMPYLPVPIVGKNENAYYWVDEAQMPKSIGRMSSNMGNAGVLIRAYIYCRCLGKKGMIRVSENATLNANYMMRALEEKGFDLAYPARLATHEFVITLKKLTAETGVTALDFAKRLLDYGMHAPTIYFPLLVSECLLIEPTETESKQTLDEAIEIFGKVLAEARTDPDMLKSAPHTLSCKRVNEVYAAKNVRVREPETEK